MKKLLLFIPLALISCFYSLAQKQFDSTSYTQFNEQRWSKFKLDTTHVFKELTENEKLFGLSVAWAEAKWNFANFDLIPSLNWDSLYQTFIPKMKATKSNDEYYKVLRNFYHYLNDGHTGILESMSRLNDLGRPHFEVRLIENKPIITKITSAAPEYKALKVGWEIIEIEEMPLIDYVQKNITPYLSYSTPQDSIERLYRYELLFGKANTSLQLGFKDNKGNIHRTVLKRERVKSLWMPEKVLEFDVLTGNIGYLRLNSFNFQEVVMQFDSLFPAIFQTKALIIDIRENGGGNGNNGFEIMGCLTDKPFYPGKTILRHYYPTGRQWGGVEKTEISGYDWKPYKKTQYNKPIVLLIGGATYSAAEDFVTAFRSVNRGKIFGSMTGGSTGQPVMFNLPGGAWGRVCSKRDFLWDGEEFVGLGIKPDIEVRQSIKGILDGRDDVLDRARNYLELNK